MAGPISGLPPLMVVEDSDEDFEALRRIFRKLGLESHVQRYVNGEKCLEALGLGGVYTGRGKRTLPGLILLDLNLPGMDGWEMLRAVKTDLHLMLIPVTVISTSANPRDVNTCYACGANAYVLKPLDYDDLIETIQAVTDFWLRTAVLPTAVF